MEGGHPGRLTVVSEDRVRRMLVALTLALACAPLPSHAAPDGCVAVGSHAFVPPQPWQCEYTASGPGNYVAATTNPFTISVQRQGYPDRIVLVSRGNSGPPVSGNLVTRDNDRVFVSIGCWDYATGAPCPPGLTLGGRDGMIVAQSDL